MYQYTEFDQQFVRERAAQYRDQWERYSKGLLSEDEIRTVAKYVSAVAGK